MILLHRQSPKNGFAARNNRAMPSQHTYIAIDLKSFYASVECVERGLNTLDTHLVVADASRTDRTICLAVSPSLKQYGTGGRPRLFEVNDKVNYLNKLRRAARGKSGDTCAKSFSASKLHDDPTLEIDFIVATPRMALYIDYSTRIHDVYLKYIAPEDIHVYSIDEVFIDATAYLKMYGKTPRQLTTTIIRDILRTTGITATAGIGPNLYLCKVAMDIVAKHSAPDEHGVRVAELDEMSYRRKLWDHRPITDFWRVGKGVAQKLMLYGIDTMGKVARCSLANEDILYGMFGINAELLIDHAWGWEPCTMDMIKSYRPETNSISNSQILAEPYSWQKAETVINERDTYTWPDRKKNGHRTYNHHHRLSADIKKRQRIYPSQKLTRLHKFGKIHIIFKHYNIIYIKDLSTDDKQKFKHTPNHRSIPPHPPRKRHYASNIHPKSF